MEKERNGERGDRGGNKMGEQGQNGDAMKNME